MLPIQGDLQGLCLGRKEHLKDGVAIKGKGEDYERGRFLRRPPQEEIWSEQWLCESGV